MKVTTEHLPKSVVALDVELDPQQVNKGLERAARKLSQQFRIPGFRPGKAPRQIVENYFGRERLMEEAADDLIQKSFPEALKQQEIVPVGRPTLENLEQEPFRYRVSVPVEPTISLPDYTNYGMTMNVEEISDEQVQKLLDAQREQHVVLQELDEPRPAQLGDQVSVTIASDLDDEDLDDEELDDDQIELVEEEEGDVDAQLDVQEDEADAELEALDDDTELDDAELEVVAAELDDELAEAEFEAEELAEAEDELDDDPGQEQQIALVEGRSRPEVLEALVGAQPGETRSVTITYGDDEESEELRDKTITYNITVNNVQARLLPEWDELPTLSDVEGDIETLRMNARQRLERAAEIKAKQEISSAFLEQLEADTEIELPDAMITERAEELFHAQANQVNSQFGLDEDTYLRALGKTHDEAVAEYGEQAERDMRRSVVLRALLERENLQVGEDDLAQERERLLEGFDQQRLDDMAKLLDTPQMQQSIRSSALDRLLNERLVALATGQTVPAGESEPEQTPDQPQAPTDDAAVAGEDL